MIFSQFGKLNTDYALGVLGDTGKSLLIFLGVTIAQWLWDSLSLFLRAVCWNSDKVSWYLTHLNDSVEI